MSTKVVFVGGTRRAVHLFSAMLQRDDVDIRFAVFARGYPNEHADCEKLVQLAAAAGIRYLVSDHITEEIVRETQSVQPDVIIGGGIWRSFIPDAYFEVAPFGFIGLHGSGLPEYRGWAGLNWYIVNGESEYVLRMYRLNSELDAGPLVADSNGQLLEFRINLQNEKTVAEVLDEVYVLHVRAFMEFLDLLPIGGIRFIPQDESCASYTCNRSPDDGEMIWARSTTKLFNFIRAQSSPYPGAFSFFRNQRFVIERASIPAHTRNYIGRIPGKVVERHSDGTVDVLTGDGILRLESLLVDGQMVKPGNFLTSVRETLGYQPRKSIEQLEKEVADIRQLVDYLVKKVSLDEGDIRAADAA